MSEQLEYAIGNLLRQQKLTIAAAESCTGGLVSHLLTNVPGSSDYFLGSVVAYAYEVKASVLGVSWMTLNTKGAVSRETVLEMARGVRKRLEADIGLSVSGIAGPGGGTPDKPAGTTWVGLSAIENDWARVFYWDGDREKNKLDSALAAMQILLEYLQGNRSLDAGWQTR